MIRNGLTGARRLDLPLITTGGSNLDLVKRAVVGENTANPTLLAQRFYSRVSLRILMSDTLADFVALPGLDTSKAAVSLDGPVPWNTNPPIGYGPVDATHPPIALSGGVAVTGDVITTGITRWMTTNQRRVIPGVHDCAGDLHVRGYPRHLYRDPA